MPPETGAEASARDTTARLSSSGMPPLDGATAATLTDDLAGKLTGKVEDVVSLIRDRAIKPVATAVRFLIFGLVAVAVGSLVAVLFAIFSIRVLDNEVPPFHHHVWASYLVVGGIFWLGGVFISRKRHPRS